MSTDNQTFSVVTPNFNMARYLPETIESVLDNLSPGDQYFIVDGGSTDGSVEIIKTYQKQLTRWVSERDKGHGDAVAKGFRLASGAYYSWINSGDLLLKGALHTARASLSETRADLIYGDDYAIDEQSRIIKRAFGKAVSLRVAMLYGGWTPLQDACFWRSSIYHATGGINPAHCVALDYDFFLRVSVAGRCLYVPKVFSAFRLHGGQISIARKREYSAVRSDSRSRVRRELGVGFFKWTLLNMFYFVWLRLEVHLLNRLRRQVITSGTDVKRMTAG
jgi:glycosyltransferase involved in cell wall biosynthesis